MSTGLGEWDLEDEIHTPADDAGDGDRGEDTDEPQLYYGSVDEFVRNVVIEVYRRKVGPRGAHRWSAQWWRSAEAIIRLEAMWRAWEHLRLDPHTGTSTWLLHHADPHMRVLLDADGPFAGSEDTNRTGEPLPYEPPPAGLFPDAREA